MNPEVELVGVEADLSDEVSADFDLPYDDLYDADGNPVVWKADPGPEPAE